MTNEQFNSLSGKNIVIISASWCAPCKVLAKTVHDLTQTHPEITKYIHKLDIDDCEELVSRFSVMSVPTTLYIKDSLVEKKVGLQSKEDLCDWFK